MHTIQDFINKHSQRKFVELINSEFYGWPIIESKAAPAQHPEFTLLEKIVKLRRFGFHSFVGVFVAFNPKDPSSLMFRLQSPKWFFNAHYYNDKSLMASYKDYIIKYVTFTNPELKVSDIEHQVDKMIELEHLFSTVN